MGRSNTYKVKNTFVDLPAEDSEFSRGGVRALSENVGLASKENVVDIQSPIKQENFTAQTPSPFMHPAQAPETVMMEMPQLGYGYVPMDNNMPTAFGDFDLSGFDGECQGEQLNYSQQGFVYDPSSGMYYFMQPLSGCGPMMGVNGEGGLMDEYSCMPMVQEDGGSTQQLLAALGEKLGKGPMPDAQDGIAMYPVYDDSGCPMPEATGGPCDVIPGQETMMSADMYPMMEGGLEHQSRMEGGGRKSRNRDRGERRERRERGDRAERGERQDKGEGRDQMEQGMVGEIDGQHGPVTFTTVMFRNIPNKYTREMLVKQLEHDMKGQFDFVYLPIDFKNKCNVGYAFINFRSTEACEQFLNNFNNVEVRKCLPGLNSRKVTEVTPARVQGYEENVQRLRNSPVMRELSYHPEWMPLVFDEAGDLLPFPDPERALDPIKPRRRGREDFVAGSNA
jgi:hypothetical protein